MIAEHLPVLQILIPLIAAPICVLLRNRHLVFPFATLVSWMTCAVSVVLLQRIMMGESISYELGGWPSLWGIEYRLDPLSGFVLLVISAVASLVLPFGRELLLREVPTEKHYLFYSAFLLCMTGLLGITITGDFFNVFVFLEISSLSAYVLIAMGKDRRALTAAYRYLIMGTIGSTFILIGIGLVYMMTGTLNMAELTERLHRQVEVQNRIITVIESRTVLAAFAFLTVGISIKLALFPLHVWLPNAYTYAPSMVSAFLASTATKVSFYLLLRVIFTIFGVQFAFHDMSLNQVLMILGLMAVFVGSAVAVYQENVKGLLAYSSVAQIGYLVLAVSFATGNDEGSVLGLSAGIVHLFNHAMIKGSLFLTMGCVMWRVGSTDLKDMKGLAKSMPWTMAAFVIGGLNLIGVPLTSGFISKWYLILAALEKGMIPVAAAALLSSLIAVMYVWRVVEVVYSSSPADETVGSKQQEAPWSMLVPMWIMIGASLIFGTLSRFPMEVARRAAEVLLQTGS